MKKHSNAIRDMLHNLVALEIMEQTSNKIVAKDFLDIENISIDNLIRKIDNITRAMMTDSRKTLEEDFSESIQLRDKDVNRIGFLIFRIVKEGLKNNRLRNKMKKSALELHYDWRLAKQIEFIANDTKRIARLLKDIKLDAKSRKAVDELYSDIENMYRDIMKARYKNDVELAIKYSVKKLELMKKCDNLNDKFGKQKDVPVLVDKFKTMVANIHIIDQMIHT
ncbi:hypothetical protein KY316_02270 [Candidatus Woesearchaeota archaeon]|nr:hypothetical protein [Candidatus Woesearchaeota archaeon]